jgi:hypothetical protein
MTTYTLTESERIYLMEKSTDIRTLTVLESLQPNTHDPVALIRCWTKNGAVHAELVDWYNHIDNMRDGEHTLYEVPHPAEPLTGKELTKQASAALAAASTRSYEIAKQVIEARTANAKRGVK